MQFVTFVCVVVSGNDGGGFESFNQELHGDGVLLLLGVEEREIGRASYSVMLGQSVLDLLCVHGSGGEGLACLFKGVG